MVESVSASVKAQRHSQFELGVALTLFNWPDLSLAVQNNWGGPDSKEKREWFAGAVVELFPSPSAPSTPNPELEDVESRLLQIMEDEFEVIVDDDSSLEVAEAIMILFSQCLEGNFSGVQRLQEEYSRRGNRGAETIKAGIVDDDDDDSVDDEEWTGFEDENDDEDVEMGDAPPQLVPRERPVAEVDEDGFTTVTGRRRGR